MMGRHLVRGRARGQARGPDPGQGPALNPGRGQGLDAQNQDGNNARQNMSVGHNGTIWNTDPQKVGRHRSQDIIRIPPEVTTAG